MILQGFELASIRCLLDRKKLRSIDFRFVFVKNYFGELVLKFVNVFRYVNFRT